MPYIADLSLWPNETKNDHLIAIGWLYKDYEYSKGEIAPTIYDKLIELLQNPWQQMVTAGRHPCPFCRYTGGPAQIFYNQKMVTVGAGVLFVPSKTNIYIAPTLVAHYIDAHEYLPPKEFIKAVESCPQMRSIDYFRAMMIHGLPK